jgi:hypothetical protein
MEVSFQERERGHTEALSEEEGGGVWASMRSYRTTRLLCSGQES